MSQTRPPASDPQAPDPWAPAFVSLPQPPHGPPFDPLPRRVLDLIRYAESRGLELAGVRLALRPLPSEVPFGPRARKVLKHALRRCQLRCVSLARPSRIKVADPLPARGKRRPAKGSAGGPRLPRDNGH